MYPEDCKRHEIDVDKVFIRGPYKWAQVYLKRRGVSLLSNSNLFVISKGDFCYA